MNHRFIENYPYSIPISLNVNKVYKCINCGIYCFNYNDGTSSFKKIINDINLNRRGQYWEVIFGKSCGEIMMEEVLE